MTGSGKMLVTAVGANTQTGLIMSTLKTIKSDLTKSKQNKRK